MAGLAAARGGRAKMQRLLAASSQTRMGLSHADANRAVMTAAVLALRSSTTQWMQPVPEGAPPESLLLHSNNFVNEIKHCSSVYSPR